MDSNNKLIKAFDVLTEKIIKISKHDTVDDELIDIWNILFDQVKPYLTSLNKLKIKPKKNTNIVLTMTSCKRFNLFCDTVNSLLNTWTDIALVDYWYVVDDNSSAEDRKKMTELYPFIDFQMKSLQEKGHLISMNMIYNFLKNKGVSFWIHIEDDMLFFYPNSYVTIGIN